MKNKKNLFVILGSITGIIVLVIVGVIVFQIFNEKNMNFIALENKMLNATKKYLEKNETILPKKLNEEVIISTTTLTEKKYLKSLNSYLPKGISCTGTINVKNNNGEYFYYSHLDCGDKYKTATLSDKIKENLSLSADGSGLYPLNNEYVFRGEWPNNKVIYAKKNWRIIKVNKANEVVLMSTDYLDNSMWDNRYNVDTRTNSGINDYSLSRAREILQKYYSTSFSKKDMSVLAPQNLCIGKRNSAIPSKDGLIECSRIIENEYISILPLYDTLNASLDANCIIGSQACQNYNYISRIFDTPWWTVTANDKSSYRAYFVNNGVSSVDNTNEQKVFYPVVHLQANYKYVKGDGTTENPYVVS